MTCWLLVGFLGTFAAFELKWKGLHPSPHGKPMKTMVSGMNLGTKHFSIADDCADLSRVVEEGHRLHHGCARPS